MKKLEIIIKPERLEDLKEILQEEGVRGMNVVSIMGCGNQKGKEKKYRGVGYTVNLLPKIKVETVVTDEVGKDVLEKIVSGIQSGNFGDGKIFVYDVVEAVRIRTDERGTDAL
jgi:nitrogen regulatory protein P-II 1